MKKENNNSRRSFLKKTSLGGLSLAGLSLTSIGDEVAYASQNVQRASRPSELKITDMRVVQVLRTPIIRIYTNQDIVGHGDVRDIGDYRYALELKSRILGENPCNVEKLFKIIKQFGYHGRQGGGVSGVETALWDLAGKAYGVPVYQMLGGKYRDSVRIYCDTTMSQDPDEYAERMQARVDAGYTALKMDIGINLIEDVPGALVNAEFWKNQSGGLSGWNSIPGSYANTEHPFTRVQVTDKGIDKLMEYVDVMRSKIGYEIPMGTDHWGHFDKNEAIKIARATEKYNLAYLEDLIPWQYTNDWKEITQSTTTPTVTGEDIYLLEGGFKDLIDNQAVDIVHPDPVGTGGLLTTKRIGDYAQQNGIPMMLHHASSPVSFLASVHAAAATENFLWLEHHFVDTPWYDDLVTGVPKPIVQDGYVQVPEKPGIGVELNEEVVKEHMDEEIGFFEPTTEWDERQSWDRLWS
ncbi:mandelate racemase/muconate lactonizing enzyme family protein [Rhodohalobacter sulfatireducens]|uniref:Mandelate racemase/muconate lactonizing enzyme family protein n=1 Tax=Rhodohalobacter sulfatireducens TaxID=2911366 RepID=A0ABS9KDW3_9BACT|nr:mandelate racemase/muconate lactonizing enzyme family protein [Rhodohalobacter sulfatireducens]MCG2589026.1 mandelate racemase/muconate lactonizing enzyme family protein [Rhodohalobacter sulfatireducens]